MEQSLLAISDLYFEVSIAIGRINLKKSSRNFGVMESLFSDLIT